MKRVAVIDGKGGGLGRAVCEKLAGTPGIELIALGTNSAATANILKGGAASGATGENAICYMAGRVDLIIGPLAIVVADSMMGEVTARMAESIARSEAPKLLLPLQKCGVQILGVPEMNLKEMLDALPGEAAALLKQT